MTRVGANALGVDARRCGCAWRNIAVSDFVIDSRENVSARSATLMTSIGANRNLCESIGRISFDARNQSDHSSVVAILRMNFALAGCERRFSNAIVGG
jgi:hypothetical protein